MKKKIKNIIIEVVACTRSASIFGFILFFLFSCGIVKETTTEKHDVSQLTEMMDSLMQSTKTWQSEFLEKKMSVFESLKEKEKNDSSYSVVINEKGDTVRERLVIFHEIEKDHTTEKEVYETLLQQYNRIDSLLNISIMKQAKSDSLIKEMEKEKEFPAELSWWQKIRLILGDFVLLAVLCLAVYWGIHLYKVYKFF